MAHLKNSERRADHPVVRTGGMVFSDGTILEPVSTAGNPERLQLARWDGSRVTIAPQFEHGGKFYQPAALDPTILNALYLPTHGAPAVPARQLLTDMGRIVAPYTNLSDRCITLGTRFSLSTWFSQNFPTAPWLSIAGPDEITGMQLLRLFHCFCRRALQIWDPSSSDLCALPREWHFTLLVQLTELSSKIPPVLYATRRRDTYILHQGQLIDLYAPCVTLTNDPCVPFGGVLQAIEIPAIPTLSDPTVLTVEAEHKIAADFQPRMLAYYFENNSAARPSGRDIGELSFSMREVARNMVACTPSERSLQAEIIEALKVQDDATRVTRWTDDSCVLIESLLSLVHEGQHEAYVGKIAKIARDILNERGGKPELGAKSAGTRLRRMEFKIEERDSKGFRLVFTVDAQRHLHELAYAFDVPAVQDRIVRCEYCRGGKNQVDAVVRTRKTRT